MQIRCNFPDISYLSETQKNNFQFLNEMSFKLHLILAWKPLVFMQIRCNFPDISCLSETQKNNFQILNTLFAYSFYCVILILQFLFSGIV